MKNSWRALASLLVLSIAVAPPIPAADQPLVGEAAPAFSLSSLDGETVSSADFAGKLIVLHFGASW